MEYKLSLSDNQLRKVASAFKKKTNVIIQLKNDHIGTGKTTFYLSERQINKLQKAKQNGTGIRLELKYEQIKSGGFLSLLLPGLGALGGIAAGASAIANAVLSKKAKDKELEEFMRHNRAMEGKGLKKKNSTRK